MFLDRELGMSNNFRSALDDYIEQQERMRRLLEPESLRMIRQMQDIAQPMMEAARVAEEAMRPLADAAKLSEDIGRRLTAAGGLDNTSVALTRTLGSELATMQHSLAGSGVLGYIKSVDDLTAGWRAAFTEVDAMTKAMGASFASIGQIATDAVGPMTQPGLADAVGIAWKTFENGLGAVDPKLIDQLSRPFTNTIGDTLRHIEALHLPRLDASVYEALQATAKSFPDIESLIGGFRIPDINFGINDELARAFERFAESAKEAATRGEAADLEALIVEADAVVAAATTDEEKQVLSPVVRYVLLTITLAVVGNWTTEALNAVLRGMLPYLVAIVTGVQAPAVLPPAGLTVPGLVAPAPPPDAGSLLAPRDWQVEGLPPIIRRAGPAAQRQTLEFFSARTRNPNTRQAYATAVMRFMRWCEDRDLELTDITVFNVTAYIEEMEREYAPRTVNQHLAAIRTLFDYFVVGHVLPANPASEVRGPKSITNKTRTPPLPPDHARRLLESIDTSKVVGLRDRALIAVMVYGCARVSAVVAMDVRDYCRRGGKWYMRLHEKDGRARELPVHPRAQKYVSAYITAAGLKNQSDAPLWCTVTKSGEVRERRLSRVDVFRMVRRRARSAKLREGANCHMLRATGITAYLRNGGTRAHAQAIAGHDSPRTTDLYVRSAEKISSSEIQRIDI
jgi:integrase/recombinase XerD